MGSLHAAHRFDMQHLDPCMTQGPLHLSTEGAHARTNPLGSERSGSVIHFL